MAEPEVNPVIRVRRLKSRFGAQVVHEGLDMEVEPDEIFGVVGGSGAGRSVLLRTILGLWRADDGSVSRNGEDMRNLSWCPRSVLVRNYVTTVLNGALISSLTGARNIP